MWYRQATPGEQARPAVSQQGKAEVWLCCASRRQKPTQGKGVHQEKQGGPRCVPKGPKVDSRGLGQVTPAQTQGH